MRTVKTNATAKIKLLRLNTKFAQRAKPVTVSILLSRLNILKNFSNVFDQN